MKAIVLAGGYATRLWPVTKERPKMLLPVGETTVIDRILGDLESDDRISQVYLSTNERFSDTFRDHLSRGKFDKPKISVEETKTEDEKLGVISAMAQLVDRESIHEETIVIAGDNLIGFDVGEFIDFFDRQNEPVLAAYDVGSLEKAKAYGLVTLNGETVVDFQEKPEQPDSTIVSIACYGFTPEVLDSLSTYLADGNNPDEPGWFIQWLQNRTTVSAFTFDDAWFDIGTLESYLDAVSWHLDGDALVAESASVGDAEIGSNVHIMPGARITDSNVENSVIFPNVTVEGSHVESSVIDRNARVENRTLVSDLIGADSVKQTGDADRILTDPIQSADGGYDA